MQRHGSSDSHEKSLLENANAQFETQEEENFSQLSKEGTVQKKANDKENKSPKKHRPPYRTGKLREKAKLFLLVFRHLQKRCKEQDESGTRKDMGDARYAGDGGVKSG